MIRAVGKTHAYCVVVQEKGAGALFRALVDEPTLASYVVVREPELDGFELEKLGCIYQPTLLLADAAESEPSRPRWRTRAGCSSCPRSRGSARRTGTRMRAPRCSA